MSVTEDRLLAVLNSAPVVAGAIVETLDDPKLVAVRDELHSVIRGEAEAGILARHLEGVHQTPVFTPEGLGWEVRAPAAAKEAAEIVLEWARVTRELPGRLRPCANPDCNKFLIDHSKPNTARWCSMSDCGNRMKARRHYARRVIGHVSDEAAKRSV
ncbi:CGNR zinc finger domain-containing protein [Planctomonas sp. JC2975]|uniref:CGNR zinc finger domain-containing protein n=1 Tax=Planctomonas sp. JC2975 TaxID=2729626 RepID=UPI0014732EED|nr:CGNR zinc finger domain-containing protein [Planctomonas sp. JC2975]NNC12575.1 CGNR zinc finger domain-containing protein [Planctomonas sp. JC2975]